MREGDEVNLKKWPTTVKPVYKSKEQYQKLLAEHVAQLSAQQQLLYASNRHAVLLIFQAMDAAGKDGVIKHVMSGVNPQGCQVFSFKHPSPEELDHDFLWRTTRDLPQRGRIGIFNRSYYEEVLIVRVHPKILQQRADPRELSCRRRFGGTAIALSGTWKNTFIITGPVSLSFSCTFRKKNNASVFLSVLMILKRIGNSALRYEERKFWKEYMKAYGECLGATSRGHAPWYVVPADDKENARLIVSQIIVDTLKGLKMSYPEFRR